ncbi:DNA-binding protein [Haloarcula sp. JP-Z28]|jgi:predicted DNA binding protein|nr:helix-turn-helix domain-containing protein [Haloarcula sinaiiensis]EMA12119.1 DNA-binding protein [Haloarcula sinaiiensis ATCC 33800]NHN63883.1 DNA-binding protein [Haloarcula sp. JP-Z28]QCP93359.1 DNA-binding protein [Haloarcula marismortui ATCC 43049]QUJ73734.1 helix-turn-helix domain-containing protein [Haloarcula sinaiiensis ATCC 33800]
MGLIAEFQIHCDALPLVSVAATVPEASIVLSLQYNHGRRPLFIVTVTGGTEQAVERALTNADDIQEWTQIGTAGDTRRYQAVPALSFEEQLGGQIDDLDGLEALATADAIIEQITVTADGWEQMGWFADRAAFTDFSSFWQRNAEFRLERLTRDAEPKSPGNGLTDRQLEALRTAYEMGHFEIPRRASLDAVATELDISASSLSERLRRAQTQLIQETVATLWPPLPE